MVTAEAAVALPALVLLVAAGMSAVAVVTAQLRCVDAAREGARAAARGEAAAVVQRLVERSAPPGARIEIASAGEEVRVTVDADARPLGGILPAFGVDATAVALREPEWTGVS